MTESRRHKKYRLLRDIGKRLATILIPPAYNSYMWFVFHTSKKTYIELPKLWEIVARGENALFAVWHQDGFISPFCLRGHDILTMVSRSDFGDILSGIMRKCHFIVVRGGSGNQGKEALAEIIEYMNSHKGVVGGIAVDGSRGPARRVQPGIVIMARETGAPIYPMRAWAKRRVFASTWDKTLIPLPFNHMVFMIGEPIRVAPDADRETISAHMADLALRIDELVERSGNFFRKGAKEPGEPRVEN